MGYTMADIERIVQGRWLRTTDPEAPVTALLTDSRQIGQPAGALFFALSGGRHDGHQFLPDLYRAGVRQFIVGREDGVDGLDAANVLWVSSPLAALQRLAAHHRARFDLPVVGITGSNGKTVIKEWLYQLLQHDYNIVRSPKSFNSQLGVPLSVWQLQEKHDLAIFEAGISRPGEMERLEPIIRPTLGIFTNIGPAHREGFSTETAKIDEKMRLFDRSDSLIFCADHPGVNAAARRWQQAEPGRTLFCWTRRDEPADLRIEAEEEQPGGWTRITGVFRPEEDASAQRADIVIPFTDPASVENAIHCWSLLHQLGVPPARIRARMRRLEPVEMRLELKAGVNRTTVINDAYNNDRASLRIALQFAAHQNRTGRLTLVLSDILQSGMEREELYGEVARALETYQVTRLIGIGAELLTLRQFLPAGFDASFFPDTDTFLYYLPQYDFHDELILLKGARPFAFERIARRLEQKAHRTVLEVNLGALAHNLGVYTRRLQPGTKVLVMVKAEGYGTGSAQVAKLLEFHKVDYLGVAYADEGIALRQAGITLPILVLNPEPASLDAMYRFRLEPEVYSLPVLDELLRFAGRDRALVVHLKLDTGMHRLGFEPPDLPALVDRLIRFPKVEVRSVFSHLASSDSPGHDDFTHRQAAAFATMFAPIEQGLGYRPLRHLVNTGGIVRFPQYHFDMVRLGIGLYGIDSSGLQDELRVVNTLKATISQIKELAPGETVGYNRRGAVTRPSRIATISVGYADGLLRLAGNGRYRVRIHGHPAPTIGNVCMDMAMVDVTDLPEVREGDEVVVFGDDPPVQELADCLQTIPYEVFTNISERVKRVYWQE